MILFTACSDLAFLFNDLATDSHVQPVLAASGRGIAKIVQWFSEQDGPTQVLIAVLVVGLLGAFALLSKGEQPDWRNETPASALSPDAADQSSAADPEDRGNEAVSVKGPAVSVKGPVVSVKGPVEMPSRPSSVFDQPIRSISRLWFRNTLRVVLGERGNERELRLVPSRRRYDCRDADSSDLVAALEQQGGWVHFLDAKGAVVFSIHPARGWHSWNAHRASREGGDVQCEVESPAWAAWQGVRLLRPPNGIRWWISSEGTRIARFCLDHGVLRVEYAPGIPFGANLDAINALALVVATRWAR